VLTIYLFPAVLALGIILIPFVSNYADPAATEQAARDTARWFWGHIISGTGFGLAIVAAHRIASLLPVEKAGRAGASSLTLVALGGSAMAMGLGADGVAPVALIAQGINPNVFFEGSGFMVSGLIMAGIILFSFGVINQVVGLYRAGLLTKRRSIALTVCAALLMGCAAIPSTIGLYVIAVLVITIYASIGAAVKRL
jgi:hypothetical protein